MRLVSLTAVKCPVCDVDLSISSREGIEIDFCPQCRGVWLDRGELDKIIERAQPAVATPTPAPGRGWDAPPREESYRDHDDRYREPPRRRRKRGFLDDLFDFD
jgi:uncharacterized protein